MQHHTPKTFRLATAGGDLTLTVGGLAQQADAAVTCRYGDTFVLATVVMTEDIREGVDYMPLLVEYEEKYYAAGKIKGSRFVKREGKPTDKAITTSRMIDRAIRPLFPKRMLNDAHVVTTVLSYDEQHPSDIPALLAASAALAVSRVPWDGPLGAVRVGRAGKKTILHPTLAETATSPLDLIVAGARGEAVMLEATGAEVPEEELLTAIRDGTNEASRIAAWIADIQKELGAEKATPLTFTIPDDLSERVRAAAGAAVKDILTTEGSKSDEEEKMTALTRRVADDLRLAGQDAALAAIVIRDLYRHHTREWILNDQRRRNGRPPDAVRPLSVHVGVVPRTHGSALFQRGETQILTTVTLGAPGDAMLLDTMTEEDTEKRYMHFYNFPAFSVGEIKPNRGPGRRDIGHGALAENALARLIPPKEAFAYTTLAVSEVLSSNGSSSMGSACGSSLALMDAGVPITAAVAGVAMGLVTDETDRGRAPVILTDIAGMEDEGGDMDFKVAGTRKGVTAMQVDTKIRGLSAEMVARALAGARAARGSILDAMDAVIAAPRKELSPLAPRIVTLKIPPEKIGDLIGPKGKHINQIIEETGVEIDVEDDGLVSITARDLAAIEKAKNRVEQLTREVRPGERFDGRVTRLMKFGAFVEILPGTEGLVHISELAPTRVRRVEDVVKIGDVIPVVVTEIDYQGRVNLSHKRAKRVH